jgi:hypothetical protein
MALVRSLRDGRRRQVAVRALILHEEHGLSIEPCRYPDLRDLRLWRPSGPGRHSLNRRSGPGGSAGIARSLCRLSLTAFALPAAPCPARLPRLQQQGSKKGGMKRARME